MQTMRELMMLVALAEYFDVNSGPVVDHLKPAPQADDAAVELVQVIHDMLARPPYRDHVVIRASARGDIVGLWDFSARPRGEGWGARFLEALCKEASKRRVTLDISAMNDKLVGYYEKFGFRLLPKSRFELTREP